MTSTLKYILTFTLLTFASLTARAIDTANETDPLLAKTTVLPYEWAPGMGGQIEIQMKK